MAEIKPIETYYNGYRFRSRLEARWAVFFDASGIKYQYEPEGFELSDGTYYLPDFYLPDVESREGKGLWVDVKSGKDGEDLSKVERFAIDVAQIAVLYPFDSGSSNRYYYHNMSDNDIGAVSDEPFEFFKCGCCGTFTYEYQHDYVHHKDYCSVTLGGNAVKAAETALDYIRTFRFYFKKEYHGGDLIDLLEKFCESESHECYAAINTLDDAFLKAKQARFEHGECG